MNLLIIIGVWNYLQSDLYDRNIKDNKQYVTTREISKCIFICHIYAHILIFFKLCSHIVHVIYL